jgi:hypothetical protein
MIKDDHAGFFIYKGGKIIFMEQVGALTCGLLSAAASCLDIQDRSPYASFHKKEILIKQTILPPRKRNYLSKACEKNNSDIPTGSLC